MKPNHKDFAPRFSPILLTSLLLFQVAIPPTASATSPISKNPRKICDGYTGKFNPDGTEVAYINVHDGLLHIFDLNTTEDHNTGIRPFNAQYPGAWADEYWWNEDGLRIFTDKREIVYIDLNYEPEKTIHLQGIAALLSYQFGDAVLSPNDDSVCGLTNRVISGDPSALMEALKIFSHDKQPMIAIKSYSSLRYQGWDPVGQKIFYSVYNPSDDHLYSVDLRDLDVSDLGKIGICSMDWQSRKMLCLNEDEQVFVENLDNASDIQSINYTPNYDAFFSDGIIYDRVYNDGIIAVNITTNKTTELFSLNKYYAAHVLEVHGHYILLTGWKNIGYDSVICGLYLMDLNRSTDITAADLNELSLFDKQSLPTKPREQSMVPLVISILILIIVGTTVWIIIGKRKQVAYT